MRHANANDGPSVALRTTEGAVASGVKGPAGFSGVRGAFREDGGTAREGGRTPRTRPHEREGGRGGEARPRSVGEAVWTATKNAASADKAAEPP